MKRYREVYVKISAFFLGIIGIIMSWGGMIYSLGENDVFRPTGIVIAIIGYALYPIAIYLRGDEKWQQS